MDHNFIELKTSELEKRLAVLVQQYTAANAQLNYTLNAADKPKLQKQLEALETEIQQLEKNLSQSELVTGSYKHQHKHWERYFPEINFVKAKKIVDKTIESFKGQEGAAIFLLEKGQTMGAKWCVAAIQDRLSRETRADNFLHYPIGFSSIDHLNELELLLRLGKYLDTEPTHTDINQYTQTIINSICNLLRSGSIVFIELTVWDLAFHPTFLPWFINSFWKPMVCQLSHLSQTYFMLKFIAVVIVNTPLSPDSLPETLCCNTRKFHREKILKLPLGKWKKDEILSWLVQYSGLHLTDIKTPREKFERMAENIYKVSNKGEPDRVYHALMQELQTITEVIQGQ